MALDIVSLVGRILICPEVTERFLVEGELLNLDLRHRKSGNVGGIVCRLSYVRSARVLRASMPFRFKITLVNTFFRLSLDPEAVREVAEEILRLEHVEGL